jgi:hypothetical protein
MTDHDSADLRGSELRHQQDQLRQAFVVGLVTPARGPVKLNEEQLARVEQVRDHGGWIGDLELEYLEHLKAGGHMGDPLPAAPDRREPLIRGVVDDFEVRIVGGDGDANVVILFSHVRWPDIRFGHQFPAPDGVDEWCPEEILLKEEIETGGLNRLMSRHPEPGADGITWMDWR